MKRIFRWHSPRPGVLRVYAAGTFIAVDLWWFGCDGTIGRTHVRVVVERDQ